VLVCVCVCVCVDGYVCDDFRLDAEIVAKEAQASNLLPAPAAAAGAMSLHIFILMCVYV